MEISYDNFQKRFSKQAEALCSNIEHPELTERLCRAGFEAVISNPSCYANHRDVYVELARIAYSWNRPSEVLVRRLYPEVEIPDYTDLISFEECIEKLLPILRRFCLIDRVVVSLALLGWKNEEIADLFNELTDRFSDEIKSVKTLTEVDGILNRFVNALVDDVLCLNDIEDWFYPLVTHDNSPRSVYETWQFLAGLCSLPREMRFSRKNNPRKERFGKLRDRYHSCKKEICVHITKTDLFEHSKVDL